MRRKHWLLAASVLLVLVAADVIYWGIATNRLRSGVRDWLAARTAQGWEVGAGQMSVGGWPRTAAVTLPTLTLRHAGPDMPGVVRLASGGVTLSMSLLEPTDLHLSFVGPLHVQVADTPDYILTGDDNVVAIPLQQDGPLSIGLRARDLRLEPAVGSWHATVGLLTARATIGAASASDASHPSPSATLSFTSEAIGLPVGIKWPLGPNISSFSADAALVGPLPQGGDIRHWAETWRDGGGSLEINHMAIGWGPLGLTSTATLALDDQLQPMGSGNGRVVGYAATLDRLAAGGILTKSAAIAAKAVLSLMAGSADGDTPSTVDVPMTLQYRTLSMRQIPLVRLPELDWPAR